MKHRTVVGTAYILTFFLLGCADGTSPLPDEMDGDGTAAAQATLLAPDQDLKDFPPWIWPIIHPADILANVITGRELSYEKAAELVKLSAYQMCECSTTGEYKFEELLAMVEASFDVQYTTLKFAKIKAAGLSPKGNLSAGDWDDDWCGTPPKRWPWPWPWLDLVRLETEIYVEQLVSFYKLTDKEIIVLEEHMQGQRERFEQLAR